MTANRQEAARSGDFDSEVTSRSSSAVPLDGMPSGNDEGLSLGEITRALSRRWHLLLATPVVAGFVAFGVASMIPPTFTASTTFLPPQQQQSPAAAALNSLGSLASLTGGPASLATSADRYIALMRSTTVTDRLIDQFQLMRVYEAEFRVEARAELASNVRIIAGKKDGLINVAVDDHDPRRAAELANRFVDELRRITSTLAMTEAQQRRVFFERQLQQARDRLTQAQQALQASGFNPNALKAEPKAAAEAFAMLKARFTAAEVRLQTLRSALSDNAPEVQQTMAELSALRAQMARTEQAGDSGGASAGPDYVGRYREFKYQETLFELYARQFELARADESREGALIQVVDEAMTPEKKSKPKRAILMIISALAAALLLVIITVAQAARQRAGASSR